MANNLYDLLGTGLKNLASTNLHDMLSMKNVAQSPFATPSIQSILQQTQPQQATQTVLQQLLKEQPQQPQPQLEVPTGGEYQTTETLKKGAVKKAATAATGEKPKTSAEVNAEVQREKLKDAQNQYALKWLTPYAEKAEQARKDNINYELMRQAAESGKLRTGWKQKLAETFGVSEIERNFEEQLFSKAAASAAASASKIFPKGTRLNVFLEKIAQRTVPSLYNSPEAITGIANINILLNELSQLEEEEAVKIIEEQGGSVPFNINSQLNKRLAPERKRIEKDILDEGKNIEKSLHKADKLQEENTLESLPDPDDSSFAVGDVIRDDETGTLYEKVLQNGVYSWKEG